MVRPNRMLASHPRQGFHPQQHTQGPTQNSRAYTHQAVRPTRSAQTCLSEHSSHVAMWTAVVPIARKARKLPALCTALGKAVLPPKGRTAELRHISPQDLLCPPPPLSPTLGPLWRMAHLHASHIDAGPHLELGAHLEDAGYTIQQHVVELGRHRRYGSLR